MTFNKIPKFQGIQFFYDPSYLSNKSLYDRLLEIFRALFIASSGQVDELFEWMNELDKRFNIFEPTYGLPDFIEELKRNGYLKEGIHPEIQYSPTKKLELDLRKNAFESIFGKLRKGLPGKHKLKKSGTGEEASDSLKPFEYGDLFQNLQAFESVKNAFINHGSKSFRIEESDLISKESIHESQCSTVLMIDISHSMILYGEDRISPAKKVALALAEMIHRYYPKDKLDFVVFGDEAWQIELKDIPYLEVGPYHTNTVAGLNLALELLNKRKSSNKHIMMITDGKPSCIKRGKELYKNSFGLDRFIVSRTLAVARKCRKQKIDLTTFMVASDPYLIEFVEQFSKEANGKAMYTNLDGLGDHILINYENNKRKNGSKR